jgi:hypothetical protein
MMERPPRGAQAEGLEGFLHLLAHLFWDAVIQVHEDLVEQVHPPAGLGDDVGLGPRMHDEHLAGRHLEHPPGMGKGSRLEVLPGPPAALGSHRAEDGAGRTVEHRWKLEHRGLRHGHCPGPTMAITWVSSVGLLPPAQWQSTGR